MSAELLMFIGWAALAIATGCFIAAIYKGEQPALALVPEAGE